MTPRFGRYRVLQPLGQGAMSMVFLARDPVLARLVAVKVLHRDLALQKSALDRFFKEAKAAARIRNPHIVDVFDFGMEGQSPYLVLEFIDGQTLQRVMDQLQGAPIPPVVAASLICQAAEGLAAAAESGVVHRDLKPANLMLSEKGYLKITDFGICHLSEHTMTRTGQVLGSPRFMSPEQVKGLKPITPQADLFSLGSVLYYCLSGRAPFQADTVPDLYRQITEEAHPSLEEYALGLDPFLVRLVDTLLEKDPAKRGEGPRWLQFQLRKYLHQKKVIDPVARLAAFVHGLSEQGFQTTFNLDAAQIRRLEGSFELGQRPVSSRKAWSIAAGVLALIGISGIAWVTLTERFQNLPVSSRPIIETFAEEKGLEPMTSFQEYPQLESRGSVIGNQVPNRMMQERRRPEPSRILKGKSGEVDVIGVSILTIYSAPPFVEVSIDGYDFGKTPIERKSLPAGTYRMVLKTKLGSEIDTVMTLSPGTQIHKFTLLSNPED